MEKLNILFVDQMVFEPKENTLYVDKEHKRMILQCPNKECRRHVTLPMEGQKHIWKFDEKTNTVSPSINSLTHNHKCHYFITDGKVWWC